MVLTASTMLPLGTKAPTFTLPDTDGHPISLSDFSSHNGLLVIFMCNHCPYVIHIADELAKLGQIYQEKNVGVIAISSNDVDNFPDDSPEKMKQEKILRGYTFPYLYDQTQEIARAYKAACTPDFYVFDGTATLVYRGQMDDSRPNSGIPVTGCDLRTALNAVLEGKPILMDQKPSMGCNIKWKLGNTPA